MSPSFMTYSRSRSFSEPTVWIRLERSMALLERLIKKDEEPSRDRIEACIS